MNAAESATMAAQLAAEISAKVSNPAQAVLICGMIAAKIASTADPQNPEHAPTILAKILDRSYNSAMFFETTGRVDAPNRGHLGMAL